MHKEQVQERPFPLCYKLCIQGKKESQDFSLRLAHSRFSHPLLAAPYPRLPLTSLAPPLPPGSDRDAFDLYHSYNDQPSPPASPVATPALASPTGKTFRQTLSPSASTSSLVTAGGGVFNVYAGLDMSMFWSGSSIGSDDDVMARLAVAGTADAVAVDGGGTEMYFEDLAPVRAVLGG
jgi:hypothetical protein